MFSVVPYIFSLCDDGIRSDWSDSAIGLTFAGVIIVILTLSRSKCKWRVLVLPYHRKGQRAPSSFTWSTALPSSRSDLPDWSSSRLIRLTLRFPLPCVFRPVHRELFVFRLFLRPYIYYWEQKSMLSTKFFSNCSKWEIA